jgi:outer membrane protein assembly factor BamB
VKKGGLLVLLGLAACTSLKAPRFLSSALPDDTLKVRDLGALPLSLEWRGDLFRSKGLVRSSGYQEDLPLRGRGTLGSPIQSFVAPKILTNNRVLLGLLGEGVQVRDLRSGALLWSYVSPIGVGSEPLVVEPYVYVAGMDSQVAKLRLDSGEVVWTRKLNVESTGGLAMDAGVVYLTSADNALWALDEKSGNPLWTYRRPSPSGSLYWSLRGSSKPVISADGSKIFAGFSDGAVVAVSARGGDLAWERVLQSRSNLFKDADLGPLLSPDGSRLFVAQVDGDLVALNPSDGGILWKRSVNAASAPAFSPNSQEIYVSSLSGELHQLRTVDGSEVWSASHSQYGLATRVATVRPDLIAVAWTSGPLTLLDPKTGIVVWKSLDKIQTVAPPTSDGERLLVLSSRNQLYRYTLSPIERSASPQ